MNNHAGPEGFFRLCNLVTLSRFLLGALMVLSALSGRIFLALGFYAAAVISDILDGFIARKQKQESELGKKLDILADNFLVVCVGASFYILKKEIVMRNMPLIVFIFSYYLLIQLGSLIFTKKLIFMRTKAANIAAAVFPAAVIATLVAETRILIYLYSLIMIYSLTEKLFLQAFKMSSKNQKSVFHIGSWKIKLIFIAIVIIVAMLLFFVPLADGKGRVCFSDGYCIKPEIRDTPEGRALGLMFRENLSESQGMLFIFDSNSTNPFWMKNMKIPIDIIFIGADKKIISISKHAIPCTKPDNECELYSPAAQYMYVVEVMDGFSDMHKLEPGSNVLLPVN